MNKISKAFRKRELKNIKSLLGRKVPFKLKPGENPLLEVYQKYHDLDFLDLYREYQSNRKLDLDRLLLLTRLRPACASTFSWAIPNQDALTLIKALGPVVEMGAGTGYWTALLRNAGVDVLAYDVAPGVNNWCNCIWSDVKKGTPSRLKRVGPKRNLLLSWPPYWNTMGSDCLKYFQGSYVFYVGEWEGCTGDDAMFERLEKDFIMLASLKIPQWQDLRDNMTIWKRRDGK